MVILHLGSLNGDALLWGETDEPTTLDVESPAYAYAASQAQLAAALKAAGLKPRLSAPSTRWPRLWSPSRGAQAVASSLLIAEPPSGRAKLFVRPWAVPAWRLRPEALLDLLADVGDQHSLAPGVVAGAELAWWAAAARLAVSLTRRGQFLPGLHLGTPSRSVWEPVLLGGDAEQAALLAAAMPPSVRALTDDRAKQAPSTPARTALGELLTSIVDELVRAAQDPAPAGLHRAQDEWLHSLTRMDGKVSDQAPGLAALSSAIRSWRAPIDAVAASPFRLVVRLDEPDGDEQPPRWPLRLLLQPHEDPSLLVDLGEVWGGRECPPLARYGPPGEYVLTALGQVSNLCPELTDALRDPAAGALLDTAGALSFLTDHAATLEQAGFRVLLPAWWRRRGAARLTQRAVVRSSKLQGSGISLDSLVDVDWQLALGDETISLDELAALAALKEPLVRLRGQWVQVDADSLARTIDALKKRQAEPLTVRAALALATGADAEAGSVVATGWMQRLLDEFTGRAEPTTPPLPAGLRAQLRPYQERGFGWLSFLRQWGLGACLADDMGLGKTLQALTLLLAAREQGEQRPALLVCPTSVVSNWRREAERFTPDLPVMVHHGLTRRKAEAFAAEAAGHALVVSSYGLLHRDIEFLSPIHWSAVLLDEAQNIKNSETLQAKAARSLRTDFRLALTGTPVENNVGDLWSLMSFLNPGLLGTAAEFRRTFFMPIQMQRDSEATERLRRMTGPFVLRRLKSDPKVIADLPAKQEMKVYCSLTREQASLYGAALADAESGLDDAEGIERRGRVLALLARLKQVCNHPAHVLGDNSALEGRSGKLSRLTEMLQEVLAADERALVFTQYAEMGELLTRHLRGTFGREVAFLHGGLARTKRDALVERFQTDADGPPVFVLSLKAGGTGLNLTRANHVFHFDRWWNPAVENQATDRAYRIGQTKNVQVHKLICAGTLEEAIDQMIDHKQAVAENVVGSGESWLTELSNSELRDLLALRSDAVEG